MSHEDDRHVETEARGVRAGAPGGRAIRVLHIGNIANNAYLNARALNDAGFDCDVICYDYYHIMGCPEWEDAAFDDPPEDHFAPDWGAIDLGGFERPRWFVQGPMADCLAYLIAKRRGDTAEADRCWASLTEIRDDPPPAVRRALWRRAASRAKREVVSRAVRVRQRLRRRASASAPAASAPTTGVTALGRLEAAYDRLSARFLADFPDREDELLIKDVIGYASVLARWTEVFSQYDAVVGYATDGILPLLCGKRPYFAYEHGTIRNIPFQPTAQGRLCALTYRESDGVFITNCDNITAAGRLGLERYRFVPHPVNERHRSTEAAAALGADLRARLGGCDLLVFHPARQHWEARRHPDWEKGNDILIRGFARFVHETCPTAGAIFVDWGQTVAQSRALLAELGVADRVLWIPPQPNRRMIQYVEAADLVADQFHLGAFGSLTPKALMCGRPVMLYLDPERHHWCFPELPPILNARTPEEVQAGLSRLHGDAAFRARIQAEGIRWYDTYHSSAVITQRFSEAIRAALDGAAP
ncbi:MAG: glycosyltransferase [Phycisphaerales bacterium]|nr:glycosyltransferase [Phycisphaerales bacterium]